MVALLRLLWRLVVSVTTDLSWCLLVVLAETHMSAHTRTVRMGGGTAWPEGLPPVESLSLGLPNWGSGSGPLLVRVRTEGCQSEGGVEPGSYCPRLELVTDTLQRVAATDLSNNTHHNLPTFWKKGIIKITKNSSSWVTIFNFVIIPSNSRK